MTRSSRRRRSASVSIRATPSSASWVIEAAIDSASRRTAWTCSAIALDLGAAGSSLGAGASALGGVGPVLGGSPLSASALGGAGAGLGAGAPCSAAAGAPFSAAPSPAVPGRSGPCRAGAAATSRGLEASVRPPSSDRRFFGHQLNGDAPEPCFYARTE
jgi:hypothetical protein